MKLHRIELAGFGPFRDRQVVDFDAFEADGIFLIAGRTGAGKSSILDGVCFALYGSVPRYTGGGLRVRSDHCAPGDPTEVVLEFSTGGATYRVTRSPDVERPKRSGTGTTTDPHAARLDERVEGAWVTLAAKPREVGELLSGILGLTREQFLQVILLAQNRFAEFLLAKNDDRQSLLRTLFGTRVYADYQGAVDRRRRDGELLLSRGDGGVTALLDEAERTIAAHAWGDDVRRTAVADRLDAADTAVRRAAYRREAAEGERAAAATRADTADADLAAQAAVRAKQLHRETLRARRAELAAAEPDVAVDRVILDDAIAAARLHAVLDAVALAEARNEAALSALDAARAVHADGEELPGDEAGLRAEAERIAERLGAWREVAVVEAGLPSRRTAAAEADAAIHAAAEHQAALREEHEALPARIGDCESRLAALAPAASGADAAGATRDRLRTLLAAAEEAERLAPARRDAEAARVDAATAAAGATSALAVLLRRRLDGHAGELAAGLVAGEPCAVCGSVEHPDPAAHGDPVTDDDIAAAERAVVAASTAAQAAELVERTAREAHASAAAGAGGATVEALAPQVSAAEVAVEAAALAVAEREAVDGERRRLVERATEVAAEQTSATIALAALCSEAEAARRAIGADVAAIDAARGTFATLAERIDADERRRRAANGIADAHAEVLARARELDERRDDRATGIAASRFADAAAVLAAERDDAEIERVQDRIRVHDTRLHATTEQLRDLELELAGAPDGVVELVDAEARAAIARAEAEQAADTATRIRVAVDGLVDIVGRARIAHESMAAATERQATIEGLAAALSGRTTSRMDLETFVLAAELEEIVAAANLRLHEMSSGRYRLGHSDALAARGAASGLGLEVTDAYTGRARPPQSLSGGESFLASLALALGLAEVVTARAGGIRLDTLFIDEGFGSLDADTLETAMSTLDALRQQGRTVGVISHVESMQDRIIARIDVVASADGGSAIAQR